LAKCGSWGQQVDLAFTLEQNTYQDVDSLQLIVKDLMATGGMGNPWHPDD